MEINSLRVLYSFTKTGLKIFKVVSNFYPLEQSS